MEKYKFFKLKIELISLSYDIILEAAVDILSTR